MKPLSNPQQTLRIALACKHMTTHVHGVIYGD